MNSFNHTWTITPNRTEIRRVIIFLKQTLELEPEFKRRVITVTEELLNNAMEHGVYGLGREAKEKLLSEETYEKFLDEREMASGPEISLHILITVLEVQITVQDPGNGRIQEIEPSSEMIGGRGISLVKKLSTSFSFKNGFAEARLMRQ